MVNLKSNMPEADVVYSDVKFTKTKKNATGRDFSPPDTTYSEVKLSKTTEPSVELPGSQQQVVSNTGSKVTFERVAIAALIVLLVAALAALGFTLHTNSQTMERLKQLTAINKNLTERRCEENKCDNAITCPQPPVEPCWKCEDGWELHETQCYYFSEVKLEWEKARNECEKREGDLVKIDSKPEQFFLQGRLKEKMDFPEDKFWIGLTDSKEEDTWLWTDGSPLNMSLKNWAYGEPDNWDGENKDGEDCVRMGEKGGSKNQKQWFDKSCTVQQKSICEKRASTGKLQCV